MSEVLVPEQGTHGNIVEGSAASSTPTGYSMKCKLTRHDYNNKKDADVNDITDLIAYFNIKEDLGNPQIEVRIAIGDTINFIGDAKLSGDEKIELVVRKNLPASSGSGDHLVREIKLNLRIIEIQNFTRIKPGLTTYILNCVSEYVDYSNKKTIKNAFNGNVGTLIKNIATNELNIKENKTDIQEDGVNIIKGIYPNLKPLNAMRWLKEYSSASNSPMFLYQTNDGVLRFKSLNKMIEEFKSKDYFTYEYRPFINAPFNTDNVDDSYEQERTYVRALSSTAGFSKFIATMEGAMASKTFTLDIANKEFKDNEQYKFTKGAIESEKSYTADKNYAYEDSFDSKSYYISKNSKAYDDNLNIMQELNRNYVHGRIASLKSYQHSIILAGDLSLRVGQLINLKVNHSGHEENTENGRGIKDEFTSGKYLIINIEHEFKKQYLQTVTIARDSRPKEIQEVKK